MNVQKKSENIFKRENAHSSGGRQYYHPRGIHNDVARRGNEEDGLSQGGEAVERGRAWQSLASCCLLKGGLLGRSAGRSPQGVAGREVSA